MTYNKYKRKKCEWKDISFDSKLERSVYEHYWLLENTGAISDLVCQAEVRLTKAGIIYKPDFTFFDNERGMQIWGEAKGIETQAWRIKRKLWMYYGPGPLQIWMGKHQRPFLKEEINVKDK